MLVDTHCHIHEVGYPIDVEEVLARAREAGVEKMICVGTSEVSSVEALDFASKHDNIYASVGVHPHDSKDGYGKIDDLVRASAKKLVAVGEIGLDYFYTHSPREVQIKALESQIQIALSYNLPIIFHVREAFDDFWSIIDNFHGVRGVLHSFTDSQANLEAGMERGLYVGVNGISTFTKDQSQKELFARIPIDRLLFETDAPFLTPVPKRGTINEPAFVVLVANAQANARSISLDEISAATTANAVKLFDF